VLCGVKVRRESACSSWSGKRPLPTLPCLLPNISLILGYFGQSHDMNIGQTVSAPHLTGQAITLTV